MRDITVEKFNLAASQGFGGCISISIRNKNEDGKTNG